MKKLSAGLSLLLAVVFLSSCFSYTDPLGSYRERQSLPDGTSGSFSEGESSAENIETVTHNTESGNESENESGTGHETEPAVKGYDFSKILDLNLVVGGKTLIHDGYEYLYGQGKKVVKRSIYDQNDRTTVCADPLCKHSSGSSCPFAQDSLIFLVKENVVFYQRKCNWTIEQRVRGEADDNKWEILSYNTSTMEKKLLFDRRDILSLSDVSSSFYGEDQGKLYFTTYENIQVSTGREREEQYLCSYDIKTGKTEKCFKMSTISVINGNGVNDETKKADTCIPESLPHDGMLYVTVSTYNKDKDAMERKVCLWDLNSGKILEEIHTDGASVVFLDGGILYITEGEDGNVIEYSGVFDEERTLISSRASEMINVAGNSIFYVKFGDSPNRIQQYRLDDGRRFEYSFDCPYFTGDYHFSFTNSIIRYCNGALIAEMTYDSESNGGTQRVLTEILLDLASGTWEVGKSPALPRPGQRTECDEDAALPSYVREVFSDGEESEGFVFSLNNDQYSVAYNGIIRGKLTVPSEHNGLPVTEIAASGFKGQTEMSEIVLPDSLKTVRESAFENCTALEMIRIPEGTALLMNGAFKGCTSLRDVWLSSTVKTVRRECFGGCSSLCALHFTDIQAVFDCQTEEGAFDGMPEVFIGENAPVSLPEGITVIPAKALFGLTTVTEIRIPESVTEIGDSAFSGTGITELVIPDTVKTIGKFVVSDCKNLKKISLPECLTNADYFFAGCRSLESVTLPASVTSLGGAFSGCSSLKELYLPDSVTVIGSETFVGCSALEKVSFSEKNLIEPIREGCFIGCTSLREIVVRNASDCLTNGKYLIVGAKSGSGTLIVSAAGNLREVKGIGLIGSNAFEGFDFGNEPVLLPDSVIRVGTASFRNCRASFIDVGTGLKTIEEFAFMQDGADRMKIILPQSLETVKPFGIAENTEIFYRGTAEQFAMVSFPDCADGNYPVYFYSENRPVQTGKYWHFVNGLPTVW